MHINRIISAASAFAAAVSAASLRQRDTDPLVASIHTFNEAGCGAAHAQAITSFKYSDAGTTCRLFDPIPDSGFEVFSASVEFLDPKCRVTLFEASDCSDPGVVLGVGGCFSLDKEIPAFKVDCPWW